MATHALLYNTITQFGITLLRRARAGGAGGPDRQWPGILWHTQPSLRTLSDELYLALNDLEHRRTKVRHPQTNGFVERFQRTLKEEFFGVTLRETLYDSVEALQLALDAWLIHYNTERPHLGYRNQGRRPLDTILLFTQPVSHEG